VSVEQSALSNHLGSPKDGRYTIAVHLAQTSVMGQRVLVDVDLRSSKEQWPSRNFVVKITPLPTLQILHNLVIAPEQHNSTLECQNQQKRFYDLEQRFGLQPLEDALFSRVAREPTRVGRRGATAVRTGLAIANLASDQYSKIPLRWRSSLLLDLAGVLPPTVLREYWEEVHLAEDEGLPILRAD